MTDDTNDLHDRLRFAASTDVIIVDVVAVAAAAAAAVLVFVPPFPPPPDLDVVVEEFEVDALSLVEDMFIVNQKFTILVREECSHDQQPYQDISFGVV
jgi:hypothetical protein